MMKKPIAPVAMNAARQPHDNVIIGTTSGVTSAQMTHLKWATDERG